MQIGVHGAVPGRAPAPRRRQLRRLLPASCWRSYEHALPLLRAPRPDPLRRVAAGRRARRRPRPPATRRKDATVAFFASLEGADRGRSHAASWSRAMPEGSALPTDRARLPRRRRHLHRVRRPVVRAARQRHRRGPALLHGGRGPGARVRASTRPSRNFASTSTDRPTGECHERSPLPDPHRLQLEPLPRLPRGQALPRRPRHHLRR